MARVSSWPWALLVLHPSKMGFMSCLGDTFSPACPVLPGQGLSALPKEPYLFFLLAAQVLPQRAPDAAGAEGGAGLPVPECESWTCVAWHWLEHLCVSSSCCPAPHSRMVVPRHCSCPWLLMVPDHHTHHHTQNSICPHIRLFRSLFAVRAMGNLLLPKAGGVLLASANPWQQELWLRFGFSCSELSPVTSRLR